MVLQAGIQRQALFCVHLYTMFWLNIDMAVVDSAILHLKRDCPSSIDVSGQQKSWQDELKKRKAYFYFLSFQGCYEIKAGEKEAYS